ncbi:hypothetical protein K474DRAFT_227238 [Panus rudis PR-1116 ss-1]|nr:hypothetical protein K474DRAFT_227238 [Panus rudis PR-1116 ss-1]
MIPRLPRAELLAKAAWHLRSSSGRQDLFLLLLNRTEDYVLQWVNWSYLATKNVKFARKVLASLASLASLLCTIILSSATVTLSEPVVWLASDSIIVSYYGSSTPVFSNSAASLFKLGIHRQRWSTFGFVTEDRSFVTTRRRPNHKLHHGFAVWVYGSVSSR